MNIFTKSKTTFQFVFTILSLTFGAIQSNAQLCIGYEFRQDETTTDEVFLDVISQQFENVAGLQFTIQYDSTLYDYIEFVSSDLPSFDELNLNVNAGPGAISVVWITDNFDEGTSFSEQISLFILKLRQKTEETGILQFIDEPTAIEIVTLFAEINNFENCNTGENLAPAFKGQLFYDEDEDCVFDETETNNTITNGWAGWFAVSEQDGRFFGSGFPQIDGNYELKLFEGLNNVEILLPSPYYEGCNLTFQYDTDTLNLENVIKNPIQIKEFCPFMNVELSSLSARSCEETDYFIDVTNNGTASAENVYLELDLDYRLTNVSFRFNETGITELGNNKYRIEVGNLAIGERITYWVEASVPCDISASEMLRNEVKVFPNEICGNFNEEWSGASLRVSGICVEEEVIFEIENVGTGDMSEPLQYVVIEDAIIFRTERLLLREGEREIITLNASGVSYFLQMQQEAGHPGKYIPSAFVEACGRNATGGYSTGFGNQFPEENNDFFVDVEYQSIELGENANRLSTSPKGFAAEHFIEPEKPIEYTIHFRNFNNRLQITDSLSTHLDIATFKPILANQSYNYILEDNLLTLDIPNGFLNADRQGFVKFSISPKSNLPLGTVISNTAILNFDNGEQVITNTVFHTLMEDFLETSTSVKKPLETTSFVSVFPNPSSDIVFFDLNNQSPSIHTLTITNMDGKLIQETTFTNSSYQFHKGDLPNGTYLFRLINEKGQVENGLFVLID